MEIDSENRDFLERLAAKYVWWKSPKEAMKRPDRVMAQVMNIGDFDDEMQLAARMGKASLREVIAQAEPGWFNARSWHYWHYWLKLAELDQVPPLPVRRYSN